MGRGRQKAKQQKIARKLKYLTTDTDYDELAKELRVQESGSDSAGHFVKDGPTYADDLQRGTGEAPEAKVEPGAPADDDLDEYAKWAAEAAAKVTSGEMPVTRAKSPIRPRVKPRRIPMPVPKILGKNGAASKTAAEGAN
ncbi:DUF3073 domain-containing protein [Bifidobacterium sp.]|jgi:hypothetical protein|uniref:DUF3073 domain-containing protein n=1 Tax=Bifidobacterium sp. TaxID=41200 RepID=UPI0025C60EAF|nr:DUF3073 domain-containing protein [Bifidobacterium sp.]MCH4209909.1 DUF3073 domain-containing protein [Bifidobacterium sp.]MCI1224866.1 DUF3073 domain-containing protein [Bifidobacterium sp.]